MSHTDVGTGTALVLGASGLVGSALLRVLGPSAVGTYRTRPAPGLVPLDARDAEAVAALLDRTRSAVVYLAAAEPNVEWCEEHPEEARELNAGPARAALAASRDAAAHVVFFSTEYVFDGASGPYDEWSVRHPLSVYGRVKCELEDLVLDAGGTVVRTTTVFGLEPPPGKNFALRLLARLRAGEPASVPCDQISTPTWSDDLAHGAAAVAGLGGVWNVAGPEVMARDELARRIARTFSLDAGLVRPTPTSALSQKARRPLRAGLRTDRLAARIGSLRPLDDALRAFREQVGS